ncbi:hypothetical protein ETD83_36920 [Actinomadura soli]|uniref:Uncharacterized protein n=1 Tax=Actinomadura soli TaxID=2508997 RepID=A0A5C4J0E8_9ACTN|nr:hypothetical protein [Actinomadura soli]TMQ90100.1 hypothetical protein ETD83_36920 [Actinomadura soli]
MTELKCTWCASANLQEGFVDDIGTARGFSSWVPGPLERGPLGGARVAGKQRLPIRAFRCADCSHLELFAHND